TQTMRFESTFTLYPQWSPDGEWLAFTTGVDTNGTTAIRRARPDSNSSAITDVETLVDLNELILYFVWSPDSEWIAFVTTEQNPLGRQFLYRMRADGSELERLHANPRLYYDLAWSPDGTQLAFVAAEGEGGVGHIYLVTGQNIQRAFQKIGYYRRLIWSDEGLLFAATDGLTYRIYHWQSENEIREVYRSDDRINRLAWRDDWLYFNTGNREQAQLFRMRADGSELAYLTDTAFDWEIPISPIVDLPWHVWRILFPGGILLAVAIPYRRFF
ncbi:MAG TPA: hypothetical protein VJZ27_02975, partial [Aggregatilineales bacterium]|nr:hypothetical protein [Aggregatilineales bacterium]